MRTIRRSTRFKKDYKREARAGYGSSFVATLIEVLDFLVSDQPLPERFHDHALSGAWAGHRDCHIRPDLVLIYQKTGMQMVELVRLGSHSELNL